MKPFFTFYGGKWRAAPQYPAPQHSTIIEPFAGAAGYSVRHYDRNVVLVDKDPVIAGLWRFLVGASRDDILRIPASVETVDDVPGPQEARWLVGFWLNPGSAVPKRKPGAWGHWGANIRARIADQVDLIRHWRVVEGVYSVCPNVNATWFVDPPYQTAGRYYRCGSRGIDFSALGLWCRERAGQVLVCENEGATWLPFQPHITIKGSFKHSKEVIWTNDAPAIVRAA